MFFIKVLWWLTLPAFRKATLSLTVLRQPGIESEIPSQNKEIKVYNI